MTTRRAFARRIEGENIGQEAHSQAPQAPVYPFAEQVTNAEFRTAFKVLAQAVTAQDNRDVVKSNMVADFRVRMNKFILDVSELVVKECCMAMLFHGIDIARLMIHAQQIEEEKLKERSRETKRSRIGDGNFSHARSDGHGRPRYRQRFSGQGSSNSPKFHKKRVSNPKPQGGGGGSSLPNCAECGRNHECKCLEGSNTCFGCGKMDHKMRNCPSVEKNEGDSPRRAQPYPSSGPSGSGSNATKQNRTLVVRFQYPNERILEWSGEMLCRKVDLFLVLKIEE
ncbi:uncharacterized protein LOC125821721 [Solanum verrucosum]|uniref:uncharacterized protein LOC125821721 n=1 Tax=Solanum verrucosum TaxID=315347 RepID=UPI0020D00018|nr:uncharacterized protein LOC125821721 [Solanum verrucosum]